LIEYSDYFCSCCAEQAARLKKLEEDEKRKKTEFRRKVLALFVSHKQEPMTSDAFVHENECDFCFRWRKRCQTSFRTANCRRRNM